MFVQVWIMTTGTGFETGIRESVGGPLDSTLTVVILVYENAFGYLKMGYGSAMSFALFVVIALVTIANARLLRYDIGS